MTLTGLLHLLVVYIVWGSTYLAIRIAVAEGSGFPPFLMAGTRVLAAGILLGFWAYLRRARLRPTRNEWPTLIGSGLLLWIGGNGCVVWAEQRAASVYAALLVGALPLWVAIMESMLDRRPPGWRTGVSLLVGFSGIAVISAPGLRSAQGADLASIAALWFAPISWGVGSVLQQRRPVALVPQASAAIQQLSGAAAFLLLSLLFREPQPAPTNEAWWAWAYLVVFGSMLGFTSFVSALRLLPAKVVMTYAYVNPVVAALLGWWILDEPITTATLIGTALVIAGVAGVLGRPARPKG
jgi:drug/metabolite transporter (DMT)-like permease